MIDKSAEIKKLLAEGKTTREIAQKTKSSLRDVHRVRQQEGIDIGALEREKEHREKDIGILENRITRMRQELTKLEKLNGRLLRQKDELEAEIERKKTEVIRIVQPVAVEPIYFPKNYDEVIKYLKTLSSDHLQYISQSLVSLMNDRAIRTLHNEKTRIEQQTRDTLKRSLGNF